jgi:hypothetical protein
VEQGFIEMVRSYGDGPLFFNERAASSDAEDPLGRGGEQCRLSRARRTFQLSATKSGLTRTGNLAQAAI